MLGSLGPFEPTRPPRQNRESSITDPHVLLQPNPDDLDEIVPLVHAALVAPGDIQLRFAVPCSLAQHGLHSYAQAELMKISEAKNCPECTDALLNVPDSLCGFDAKAKELVTAIKPTLLRTAAEQILESIDSGDTSKIGSYLEGTITNIFHCGVCDKPQSTKSTMSREQFLTFVRGAEERETNGPSPYFPPVLLFCDGRCCSGPTTRASHSGRRVMSICFRGSAAAPKLESISAVGG